MDLVIAFVLFATAGGAVVAAGEERHPTLRGGFIVGAIMLAGASIALVIGEVQRWR